MKDCICKTPILKPNTRECGSCGDYINRIDHIILTDKIYSNCSHVFIYAQEGISECIKCGVFEGAA